MAQDPTFYELLNVPMMATTEEIRRAYHKRANECHPDRVRNLDAEIQALAQAKMTQINEAYQVLIDSGRRQEYDQWLLANTNVKVDAQGVVSREQPPEPEPGLTTEELIAKLEKAINFVKNQILVIDPTIRWKECEQQGFDVVLEGMRKIERFFVYINTVDVIRAQDAENLIANAPGIVAEKRFLLHKKFSLFLILYMETHEDDRLRAVIRDFNNLAIQKGGSRRTDTTMVAMLNIMSRELYFPYVKGFQPDFSGLTLPA